MTSAGNESGGKAALPDLRMWLTCRHWVNNETHLACLSDMRYLTRDALRLADDRPADIRRTQRQDRGDQRRARSVRHRRLPAGDRRCRASAPPELFHPETKHRRAERARCEDEFGETRSHPVCPTRG